MCWEPLLLLLLQMMHLLLRLLLLLLLCPPSSNRQRSRQPNNASDQEVIADPMENHPLCLRRLEDKELQAALWASRHCRGSRLELAQ